MEMEEDSLDPEDVGKQSHFGKTKVSYSYYTADILPFIAVYIGPKCSMSTANIASFQTRDMSFY